MKIFRTDLRNSCFFRCYAGAEEEMVRCNEEDCPADACSKTCGGPFKEDIVTCETLYEENTIDTIGYVLCLNKISVILPFKITF